MKKHAFRPSPSPAADGASANDLGARLKGAWSQRQAGPVSPVAGELARAKSLAHYCAQGAWAMAAALVEQGVRSDIKDSSVKSDFLGLGRKCLPIQMAASAGEAELLGAMLRSGAQPDACNGGEPSRPLALALWGGHEACVRALIKAGASLTRLCSAPGRPQETPHTPLMTCVSGAQWGRRGGEGSGLWEEELRRDRGGCLRALVEAGADLNQAGAQGATPLSLAAKINAESLVTALLELGADPNRAEKTGETPAGVALRGGAAQALLALLRGGARLTDRERERLAEMPFRERESASHSYWDSADNGEAKAAVWEGCLAEIERREIGQALAAPASQGAPARGMRI